MSLIQSHLPARVRDNRLLVLSKTPQALVPTHRQIPRFWSIKAAQNGRPQFEVDPDKAREALKNLDQQLKSISERPISTPIKKVREPGFEEFQIREQMPEISESFLGYTAAALLMFTMFYNILFYTVIKPAIDLPSDPTANVGTALK